MPGFAAVGRGELTRYIDLSRRRLGGAGAGGTRLVPRSAAAGHISPAAGAVRGPSVTLTGTSDRPHRDHPVGHRGTPEVTPDH